MFVHTSLYVQVHMYVRMDACVETHMHTCLYVCMFVCMCPHNPSDKVHVGGDICCRVGSLTKYKQLQPLWRCLGPLGTEGVEGETADQDVPETWGWTLPDSTSLEAAARVHLYDEGIML